jgi:ATP-dependent RNA helicase RhlE
LQTFSEFGLCEPIQKALVAEGYTNPTPIQQQSIPPILAGRDLCGIAQTGTGKTAAFALPILNRFAADKAARKPRACRALVLSPTRELASQIAESFRTYGRRLDLKTAVIFGGVSQGRQAQELARGVDILVATPGRLLDLVEQRLLTLAHVEVLVLDEADQMLDLGFIVPLRRIVKLVPAERQTLFFSATMPKTIAALASDLLDQPVQVAVKPVATTAERVEQSVIFVQSAQKQPLLEKLLADPAMERVLVFTRTKHGADKVVRGLDRAGVRAQAIHGNKSQAQRERALAGFKSGAVRVLVATDIAARGIHVESVTHVVNFDLPNVPESYVHRIGRTARAGAAGIAISFCNGEERAYLRDIEKLTRASVPAAALPAGVEAAPAAALADPRREQPRRNGRGQQPGAGNRHQPSAGKRKSHRPRVERSGGDNRERHGGSRSPGLDERGLPAFLTRSQRRGGEGRA